MPVYNAAEGLERAVNSILAQTYRTFELILVDDGSTDGSEKMCDQFAATYDNVFVIHQQNKGSAGARNAGLRSATGDYIAFADADDVVHRDYLSELYKAVLEHDVSIAYCVATDKTPDEAPQTGDWPYKKVRGEGLRIDETFDFSDPRSHKVSWGALFCRELLNGLTFDEDLSIGEDTLFTAKAMLRAGNVWYLPEPLYCYVVYESSMIHGRFDERKLSQLESWKRVEQYYPNARSQYVFTCMHFLKILAREKTEHPILEKDLRQAIHDSYKTVMGSKFSKKIKLQFWLAEKHYEVFSKVYEFKKVSY